MSTITWVLESDVFPETHDSLRHAIRDRRYALIDWNDEWWSDGIPGRVALHDRAGRNECATVYLLTVPEPLESDRTANK